MHPVAECHFPIAESRDLPVAARVDRRTNNCCTKLMSAIGITLKVAKYVLPYFALAAVLEYGSRYYMSTMTYTDCCKLYWDGGRLTQCRDYAIQDDLYALEKATNFEVTTYPEGPWPSNYEPFDTLEDRIEELKRINAEIEAELDGNRLTYFQ